MWLISVIGIFFFVLALSADEIPNATKDPQKLQLEKGTTHKPDVKEDIEELFKHDTEPNNTTDQFRDQRPIALEGGSSVVANDTRASEIDSPKEHGENSSSAHNSVLKGANYSKSPAAIETEGGVLEVPVSTTTEVVGIRKEANATIDLMNESFQLSVGEESEHPSVVPRKGVSPKIVPRKGVNPYEPFPILDNNTEIKSPACNCCETHSGEQTDGNYTTELKCVTCCNSSDGEKPNISVVTLGNNSVNSSSYSEAFKSERPDLNSTVNDEMYRAYPPLKKKLKPLVTLDEEIEQKQQKFPQSSSPEKTDFVIPVVLVILAVPIVVVLAMIFYRKGTEFWERRHYRRMDFLIDGMYND